MEMLYDVCKVIAASKCSMEHENMIGDGTARETPMGTPRVIVQRRPAPQTAAVSAHAGCEKGASVLSIPQGTIGSERSTLESKTGFLLKRLTMRLCVRRHPLRLCLDTHQACSLRLRDIERAGDLTYILLSQCAPVVDIEAS